MSGFAARLHQEHKERLNRIALRAVPDHPVECLSASERVARAPTPRLVIERSTFAAWVERQDRLHPLPAPFKEPWFSIEDDGEPVVEIKKVDVAAIQKACARHFGLTMAEFFTRTRHAKIVFARQTAMFLCRKLTTHSLPYIGKRFRGMDHSTALHGIRRTEAKMKADPEFRATVEALAQEVGGSLT